MKCTIGKKKWYVTMKPAPKKSVLNGLRLHWIHPDGIHKVLFTDIVAGKSKYFIPKFIRDYDIEVMIVDIPMELPVDNRVDNK